MRKVDPRDLLGLSEVADMLGWDRRRVATYSVRGLLPQPIAHLKCGQIWSRQQIEDYQKLHRE
jgi:hypothetical protein